MLSELSIENFAIIDSLLLRLEPGFTVITGETGAGKSIIIDALQTALGARISAEVVRSGARYAAVEAVFDVTDAPHEHTLRVLLQDAGIGVSETLILRREINAGGRGTARVNGRAVPLSVLDAIGDLLVDIHGQSDHLSVLRRDRQLDVLDRFGDLLPLRARVAEALRVFKEHRDELRALEAGQREAERKLDLLRFQVEEIEAAALRPEEEEELMTERHLLTNAEKRSSLATAARERLHGETGAASPLAEALRSLHELADIDPTTGLLRDRVESAHVEVDDIAGELRAYIDGAEYDPRRLSVVEERLELLRRLQRKYGSTVAEIIGFGEAARSELESIERFDERLERLREEIQEAETRAGCLAEELSERRHSVSHELASRMRETLQGLGLINTDFAVQMTRREDVDGLPLPAAGSAFAYTGSGVDSATFVVSFNLGEPLRPLDRVASGGETSRFLLALKSVLAGADATPTLVFDEVDVGVGARHGRAVAQRLKQLAETHQVLSITHLPQVAALGDHHLSVHKTVIGDKTSTAVSELDADERVGEIAEMMTGTGTDTARQNAAELLESARRAS